MLHPEILTPKQARKLGISKPLTYGVRLDDAARGILKNDIRSLTRGGIRCALVFDRAPPTVNAKSRLAHKWVALWRVPAAGILRRKRETAIDPASPRLTPKRRILSAARRVPRSSKSKAATPESSDAAQRVPAT